MEKAIEIKKLSKTYNGKKVLNNLSLELRKGEILGLLGPNGSGKTTTINCLLSLLDYEKGSIKILGEEMTPNSFELKKKIGVVFQDVAVFDELTVKENLDYFCGLYITDEKTRQKYVEDALNLVSLKEFSNYFPEELSGGLLRRLNIACGIAHKPEIIILDEPTVAIDPQSRNNILEKVIELNKNGASIIYTSHYMDEIEMICDRIIVLDKGKIIAHGNKDELKAMIDIEQKIILEFEKEMPQLIEGLYSLENVKNVNIYGKIIEITYGKGLGNIVTLIKFLDKEKAYYKTINTELPSLNDVFLELTGKELRDEL